MEAAKTGCRLPIRPSDGLRPRRGDDSKSSSGIPRSMARSAQPERRVSNHARSNTLPLGSSDRGITAVSQRRLSTIPKIHKAAPDQQFKLAIDPITPPAYSSRHQLDHNAARLDAIRSLEGLPTLGRQHHAETRDKQAEPRGARKSSDASISLRPSSSEPSTSRSTPLGIRIEGQLTESPRRLRNHEDSPTQPHPPAVSIYPELDRYRNHQQPLQLSIPQLSPSPDFVLHTPPRLHLSTNSSQLSASSLSVSTKLFDTPGPSMHSRDTTPTSVASQSPNLATSARSFPLSKHRHQSPSLNRLPLIQRRSSSLSSETAVMITEPHGLSAVKESLASPSSSSPSQPEQLLGIGSRRQSKSSLEYTPLASPLSLRTQSPFFPDEKRRKDSINQSRRQSQRLSRPEAASASKRLSIPKPSPAASSNGTRSQPPGRATAAGQVSQMRNPVPTAQGNLLPRDHRSNRRSSEPSVAAEPARNTTRNVPNKSMSMDHGSSMKRDNLMRPAAETGDSLTTHSFLRSRAGNMESQSSSRFQFFGFRKRNAATSQGEKVLGSTRKGPAAGTGHEGYGNVRSLRRQSVSLNGLTSRNPSANSVSSDKSVPVDKFLADRMNPVIIAGGTVIENQNFIPEAFKTGGGDSRNVSQRPSTESRVDSVFSSILGVETQTTVWPTAASGGAHHGGSIPWPPPDTSDASLKPPTALRRTVQRLKSSSDNTMRLPHIRSKDGMELSRMQSCNTSIMSVASSVFDASANKLKKDRSHRKWNLFGRSRNKSTPSIKSEQVSVTVMPAEKKPIAFYAIMDPADEEDEPMDVQTALREAQVYGQPEASDGGQGLEVPDSKLHLMHSSPELMNETFPQQTQQGLITPKSSAPSLIGSASSRIGRLVRVGRIPQVVNGRRDRSIPPFVFPAPDHSTHAPTQFQKDSVSNGERFRVSSSPLTINTDESFLAKFSHHGLMNDLSPEQQHAREFLAFKPRKKSDCTTYSSSSDSGTHSFAATAVIPKADDPYAEDEIWDEYNDLLGLESAKAARSATSPAGRLSLLEAYDMALSQSRLSRMSAAWPLGRGDPVLPMLPEGAAPSFRDTRADPHGYVTAALPQPPTSHVAATELKDVTRTSPDPRLSITASRKTRESGSSTSSEEWSPSAQVNLRIGSMTVSKWLTFSHILFSDIRHELTRAKDEFQQPSILVIDGLGNDDWSYYAAESLPEATIFNISPREAPKESKNTAASMSCLRPPNHRQVQYLSHLDKFPFASCTFSCVVFRFPAAAPESHFQNILLEARRVLKPEGYIEMSILDLDLHSVGHRARTAIRQLKEEIHERSPETNLASTSDVVVRLLGKAGFTSIRAARVGIPVASSIGPRSSIDAGSGPRAKAKKTKVGDQPSLQEMMTHDGPAADQNITSMVARVGRWWYSRCYEDNRARLAADPPPKSIWADRALLKECEEQGTSLKLMVCCARSPDRTRSF